MKTPEEMAEFFRSVPSRKKENPYWRFEGEKEGIYALRADAAGGTPALEPFCLGRSGFTLYEVRDFFRLYYESFHSEAQVLCVSITDAALLRQIGVPELTTGNIGPFKVSVMVLPQDNHMGTSVISELFWQKYIVGNGITPIARIHSHHVLDPYQSITDYSTLNSGTLEMVIGHIFEDKLQVCYWLDVPGTDIKANTFLADECPGTDGHFIVTPHVFHKAVLAEAEEAAEETE